MNQFLSNKIISGIVAVALLVGVGVLVSSGDTSSTTRNADLVVATPCTKPGQVTKVSRQSVVCATTNAGSLWYATMKAKGKAQECKSPGAIRKKSNIVWVCGVIKKKTLWQATQPLPPAVVATTTVIEPGVTQPTPGLDSTKLPTPDAPLNVDNAVLVDPKIPDDKTVTKVIEDVTTPTIAPITPLTPITPEPTTCAWDGTCKVGDIGLGGGNVFYVALTPFKCGVDLTAECTYLEVATTATTTSSWTPDTTIPVWGCKGTDVMKEAERTASFEIGTGKANTDAILKKCTTADIAADVANKYSTTSTAGAPGAAGQWFLPSRDELNELCKYARSTGQAAGATPRCTGGTLRSDFSGVLAGYYWSSSESFADYAWGQRLDSGYNAPTTKSGKDSTLYVRPVRAF